MSINFLKQIEEVEQEQIELQKQKEYLITKYLKSINLGKDETPFVMLDEYGRKMNLTIFQSKYDKGVLKYKSQYGCVRSFNSDKLKRIVR